MPAGSSAEMLAAKERQKAANHKLQLKRSSHKADCYEKGTEGERLTAKELSKLSEFDYHIFHDREVNGIKGNVDHIIVGPAGVFVLNTKNWSDAKFKNNDLYASGRKATRSVERLEKERLAVEKITKGALGYVEVKSVLVFTDGFEGKSDMFSAFNHTDIAHHILSLPVVFSPNEVDELSTALLKSSKSSSEPSRKSTPDLSSGSVSVANAPSASSEDIFNYHFTRLYIKPWNRGGKKRLYVKDAEGKTAGWKDCVTSEVHIPEDSPVPTSTAAILKISNKSQINEIKTPEVPQGDKFSKRLTNSFLGKYKTIALGWVWENYGNKRVYVHLLTRKKKPLEVGYVDLKTGEVKVTNEINLYGLTSEYILEAMADFK